MAPLPPEVRASYVVIIDNILDNSDMQTISSKRVRQGLQDQVDYDITPQKDEIKKLIIERFDKFAEAKSVTPPATNGHSKPNPEPRKSVDTPDTKVSHKRKSESDKEEEEDSKDDVSDVANTPPPKKKRKNEISDAALAAKLQAEENHRARPTRGGASRKAAPVKKRTPKKKTAARVKASDDSEVESGSAAERKVNRSGGFHKPLNLSAPLAALLNETQLSRPQTVKRIWEYVKARDLQDPSDKRQIRCDDALKAVFKSDKVHMFTMNKILGQNLYDPEA